MSQAAVALDARNDNIALPAVLNAEPVGRNEDVAEYRKALTAFKAGRWDADRWKTFRLRFGVYAELEPGKHMIRVKIPGGRLSHAWLRGLAAVNRTLCKGHIHFTTRQDAQIYGVDLDGTADVIEGLAKYGLTTRESSGSTFRNVTACPLAGVCPKEHVDAGEVAQRLTTTWLRHPLVQHMPRKFKSAVSGCSADCGAVSIDDLGFIATEKDGKKGFRVLAGGGLGARPRSAVEILDFAEEHELPAVQEAIARVHHKFSDRGNRNRSRLKFLVDRFGQEKLTELFLKELDRAKKLPQRPWEPLSWRQPSGQETPVLPGAVVEQHSGGITVVVRPPLGSVDAEQLSAFTALAEAYNITDIRSTRDQNLVAIGLTKESVEPFISEVRKLGLAVNETPNGASNLVSCPGTSSCPIGITNSNALSKELTADPELAELGETRIRISGCQNSCGQHHVGDFGLHGVGKKVEGRHVPHYQIHLGGLPHAQDAIGISFAYVPARQAGGALKALIAAYQKEGGDNETVRDWVERVGKNHIDALVEPFTQINDPKEESWYVDLGKTETFTPPTSTAGECAAPAIVAEYLSDLAKVGLIDLKRAAYAGDVKEALRAGKAGLLAAARRLLAVSGIETKGGKPEDMVFSLREHFAANKSLIGLLDAALAAEERAQHDPAALNDFGIALEAWIDRAEQIAEIKIQPLDALGVPA